MAGVDTEFEGEAIPMSGIKIGYLPQEPQLDADKTVREEVESGLGDVAGAQKNWKKYMLLMQNRMLILMRWLKSRHGWKLLSRLVLEII